MSRLKRLIKKIDKIVENISIEEIEERIKVDEMEEDIKVLEHLINDLKKKRENPYAVINENFVEWDGVFLELNLVINSLENLINRNKELEEKVNKYEKQIDLEWVEENYIEKSKISKYLNKMEKRCDKPKFSVMKKEIEQLLQEGDK